jgi:hypothetical protein
MLNELLGMEIFWACSMLHCTSPRKCYRHVCVCLCTWKRFNNVQTCDTNCSLHANDIHLDHGQIMARRTRQIMSVQVNITCTSFEDRVIL